jgi:hypothetical protein
MPASFEEIHPPQGEFDPSRYIRDAIKNAPWFVMALMIHVILIAVLSFFYVEHQRAKDLDAGVTVSVAPTRSEAPPEEIEPPEIIDRQAIPKLVDNNLDPTQAAKDIFIPTGDPLPPDEVFQDATENTLRGDPTALQNLPRGDTTGGSAAGVGKIGHYGTGIPDVQGGWKLGSRFGDPRGGKQGTRLQGGGIGTEQALLDALEWLKKHQDPEGRWDSDGFSKNCKGTVCDGPGEGLHDIGVTGLALLAFLGDGNTLTLGPYRTQVARGVKWLLSQQERESGLIGEKAGQTYLYNHAIATLALCEAFMLSNHHSALRGPAQRGVNFILAARNPYKVWRYQHPPNGDNDTSVTGWMVFALKSAEEAGLSIDKTAFDASLAWFDEMTDPASGRCGYQQKGEPSARRTGSEARFPPDKTESLTAVALLCRIFIGQSPDKNPILRLHADRLRKSPPVWEVSAERSLIDEYYWYYGTYAMFQMGGEDWKVWNTAMKKAVIDHQRHDGCENGSWDPLGAWGKDGGRVYMTAIGALCMEVYFRYSKVLGAR